MVAQAGGASGGSVGGDAVSAIPAPSRGSVRFSCESQGTGTPGFSLDGGGVCHGHIPKAERVPKDNDVPETDRPHYHIPSANCVPKDNPVPKPNHIPDPPMSPWPTTSPWPVMSPVPTVSPRPHFPKPDTSPVPATSPRPTTSPTTSSRSIMSPRLTVSLRLVMSPWPLSPMVRGSPAQPAPFGPLEDGWRGHTLGTRSPPCPAHVP